MDTYAISAAQKATHRYKTRNPFEAINCRKIKLRSFTRFKDLLGYYIYCTNVEYIGINANATDEEKISAAAHELGHALVDGPQAASESGFHDTRFYSVSNAKSEMRANTFAAEFLLPDEFVLERLKYYEYNDMLTQMETSLPAKCSQQYRARRYMELIHEFYCIHDEPATSSLIASEAGIEPHLVDFKLRILTDNKGYKLPCPPELQSDFFKDVMKRNRYGD